MFQEITRLGSVKMVLPVKNKENSNLSLIFHSAYTKLAGLSFGYILLKQTAKRPGPATRRFGF